MNNKILQEVLEDLRSNPNACTTVDGATLNGTNSILESNPGEKLTHFFQYLYENNLFDYHYGENIEKIKNKKIEDLTKEEIFTKLSFIIRGDRFCSGLIYSNFKDGTLLKLIEQLQILENKQ